MQEGTKLKVSWLGLLPTPKHEDESASKSSKRYHYKATCSKILRKYCCISHCEHSLLSEVPSIHIFK